MKSAVRHRLLSGRFFTFPLFALASSAAVLACLWYPLRASAQQSAPAQPSSQAGMTHASVPASPLAELVKEAEQNNPEIAAAVHGWQASTHVQQQMSALP